MGKKNIVLFRKLRRRRYIFLERRRLSKEINKLALSGYPVRLNIGSSIIHYESWISLDLPFFDLLRTDLCKQLFGKHRIDNILMEHVLEHLTPSEVKMALLNLKPYLKKNTGIIRIAVPDKNHPNPLYIEYVRPNGSGPGANDHKSFWNLDDFITMSNILGYEVQALEYYDISGTLHHDHGIIDESYGVIRRSAQKRSNNDEIHDYSSLIVDLKITQRQ